MTWCVSLLSRKFLSLSLSEKKKKKKKFSLSITFDFLEPCTWIYDITPGGQSVYVSLWHSTPDYKSNRSHSFPLNSNSKAYKDEPLFAMKQLQFWAISNV